MRFALILLAGALLGANPASPVSFTPTSPRPGDLFLVEVEGLKAEEVAHIDFQGRRWPVWNRGKGIAALIGAHHKKEAGRIPLSVVKQDDKSPIHTHITLTPRDFDKSELSVDKGYVDLPKRVKRRVKRERKLINAAFSDSTDKPLWHGAFLRPMGTEITGNFGTRRIFNGKTKSTHRGLDLDGKRGDPIKAVNDGRVVMANDLYYTGKCVFIDHGLGLFSVYFHMSALNVKKGQRVKKGQLIGKVGATGRVTGPHLHLGIKASGLYVDPLSVLALSETLKDAP